MPQPAPVPFSLIQFILMACIISIGMGQFIVFAVLAPLIRSVGLQEIHGGLIISFSSIIFALSSGVWGRISSVYGRRKVMQIGLYGYCCGTLLFAAVFYAGLQWWLQGTMLFLALSVARMLQSTLMGATTPAATAYMADITTPEQRVKGMGLLGSAHSLGTILGPALAAPLILLHLLAPLLAASVITLLTALVVWKWLPRHDVQAPHAPIHIGREILRTLHSYFDPRYAGTLLIGVLMFLGYAMCQQTVGYLVQDRLLIGPEQTASIVAHAFICSAIFALTAQLLVVARLKLAPSTLLFLGLPMMLAGYVVLVQLQWERDALIAFSFIGFGFGLALPGFSATASLSVSAEEQGAVAGIIAGAPALGFILGPTLGAILYEMHTMAPYAAAALLNGLLAMAVLRRNRKQKGI
ncbi:MAG: MFS transporter [Ketobacter sp.]|uniref:MFS transporter n=1 Tax=unclassified Ketobacter TaxID=2639109 RepID=UPI0025C61D96|nr:MULTISPECIES: MFS transporter [unclassified Ketobacter]MCK5791254.1 MFS transporter [Ketobacter sp.]MEC8813295.1 MFS transporter [Pseudomonadota bacterium]